VKAIAVEKAECAMTALRQVRLCSGRIANSDAISGIFERENGCLLAADDDERVLMSIAVIAQERVAELQNLG
jgi:hypothetical protein